jgi:dienelactone hydrolase
MVEVRSTRYRDEEVVYAGVRGEDLVVPSANPRNHHEAITRSRPSDEVLIDAKLFVPPNDEPLPTVIIVPGSLGVGPNHEQHAATLVAEGFAVCVVDPFGPRAVTSTVANQTLYSFAASAYDVLATFKVLSRRPEIDARRIAAQGHSRGGAAVVIAACRRFADPIVGEQAGLAAAYAVYPWCGQQFADPNVGSTRVRAIIGDRDEWCSVQQVQAQIQAMRVAGGDATLRIVAGAAHSFDRLEPVSVVEEARVSPAAPTVLLADDGAMIDPYSGRPDADLCDGDVFRAAIAAGFGRKGASIGGGPGQPELFTADMLAFHVPALSATMGR